MRGALSRADFTPDMVATQPRPTVSGEHRCPVPAHAQSRCHATESEPRSCFAIVDEHAGRSRSRRSLLRGRTDVDVMSGILGVFGAGERLPGDGSTSDVALRRMLGRMSMRGNAHVALWREGGVALAVARHDWEFGPGFSGPVLVVQDNDCVVAADATLYYRDDLRRKLTAKGVRPSGQTASHLVLAAYRAWGERCAAELEGDFAFILYDRTHRRVVAARDFAGKRPLFYSELPGGDLAVASTAGSLLAHPACPQELDLVAVVETMAAFIPHGTRTCHRAIRRLDAGHTLVRERCSGARTAAHWEPPVFESSSGTSFTAAAEELRELLLIAVAERMSNVGLTSVWMSGGRDSTAVFAAVACATRERGTRDALHPVSVSYPPGDPGREDEYIHAIASFWECPVRWVRSEDVPLLDRPAARALARDEPFAHVYEQFNRELARESAAINARIALDGVGGDQLFLVSCVYLSDLLRGGRWFELAREWRAAGFSGSGFRTFFRWAVQPALPDALLQAARIVRHGRPLQGELRRRLPEWVAPAFARQHGLSEYVRALPRPRRGESIAATETRWYFTDPFFPTVFGLMAEFALEEGVELRSPLYDARLLRFAATRPRTERSAGHETKRLLRHAMRGLLPDSVLKARAARTGVASGYFDRAMRKTHAAMIADALEQPLLSEIGVVDRAALDQARNLFMRSGEGELGLRLFQTVQAEWWMRGRLGRSVPVAVRRTSARSVATASG